MLLVYTLLISNVRGVRQGHRLYFCSDRSRQSCGHQEDSLSRLSATQQVSGPTAFIVLYRPGVNIGVRVVFSLKREFRGCILYCCSNKRGESWAHLILLSRKLIGSFKLWWVTFASVHTICAILFWFKTFWFPRI